MKYQCDISVTLKLCGFSRKSTRLVFLVITCDFFLTHVFMAIWHKEVIAGDFQKKVHRGSQKKPRCVFGWMFIQKKLELVISMGVQMTNVGFIHSILLWDCQDRGLSL